MSVIGNIGPRLIDFLYEKYLGEEAYHELAGDFLGVPYRSDNPHFDTIDAVAHREPLFLSWLWHDWREPGSDEPMIAIFAKKAQGLTNSERTLLNQMARSQVLSLFRVGDFRPGNIGLEDLRTGVEYRVREYSLASQINTGQLLFLRLARQNDRWEIIMPDTAQIQISSDDEKLLEALVSNLPEQMTIKNLPVYKLLLQDLGIEKTPLESSKTLPLAEARQELALIMDETGISGYLSINRIEELMRSGLAAKEEPLAPPEAIRLLVSLVNNGNSEQFVRVMNSATAFWNALGPDKARKKRAKKGYAPDIYASTFEPYSWIEQAEQAHDVLVDDKVEESARLYDQLFSNLLKDRATPASVYRLLANAGVAHLGAGDILLGEHLIDKALELCPDYDFALRQQEMIDDGAYIVAGLRKMSDQLPKLPPTLRELRRLSDDELIEQAERLGMSLNPDKLPGQLSRYKNSDDALKKLWSITEKHEDIDEAIALVEALRERWASQVVWPDTLNQYAAELDCCIYPLTPDEESDWVQAETEVEHLRAALKQASKGNIRAWMHDTTDYAAQRQNLVYYTDHAKRSGKTKLYRLLVELCEMAYNRTGDAIFTVPGILADARSDVGDAALIRVIDELVHAGKFDHAALQIVGNNLPAKRASSSVYAFEKALGVLDFRIKKKRFENPPYDYAPIGEHYEYIAGQLNECYEKAKQRQKIRQLSTRLGEVLSDGRLNRSRLTDAATKLEALMPAMLREKYPSQPILAYLDWFATLGINLSLGDGQETRVSFRDTKIGRNEPCPCGSGKKYKKCHGRP